MLEMIPVPTTEERFWAAVVGGPTTAVAIAAAALVMAALVVAALVVAVASRFLVGQRIGFPRLCLFSLLESAVGRGRGAI